MIQQLALLLLMITITAQNVVQVVDEEFKLVLLHNNDMHSRFEETAANSGTCSVKNRNSSKCVGGFARTAHEIRRYRHMAAEKKIPPVLYLNAGDTYQGTAWFSVYKWQICVEFLNILHPDAMSFGNHEFDDGIKGLAPFVDGIQSPIVAANLDFSKEPTIKNISKSVVLNISDHKIGIIGYLTPETKQIATTEGTIFLDEVAAIREESERLDREGVKILIALGHSGYTVDQLIAAEVPLIDVVVGGHTNTFLWNGAKPSNEPIEDPYPKTIVQKSGKKVPVVQAYAYTKYLGRLNLTFNAQGDLTEFAGQPILLDHTIPQDQDILDLLDKYRPKIEEMDKQVIGKSKVILDGKAVICRQQECNFGNLIADAFVYYVASLHVGEFWTSAPIGLLNGGGIRNLINPLSVGGNITYGELLGCIPFGSQVVTLTLSGAEIIRTLELGVRSNGETSRGEFLQVSGLHVVYDLSKPANSRVVSVEARCGDCEIPRYELVDLTKNYTVVTSSFLTNGGDGHVVLEAHAHEQHVEDLIDIDVVSWYIAHQSPIYPEVQGRIKFVDKSDIKGNLAVAVRPLSLILVAFALLLAKLF